MSRNARAADDDRDQEFPTDRIFGFCFKGSGRIEKKTKMIAGITRSQTGPTKIRQYVTTVERSFVFPFQELPDQNCFTSLKVAAIIFCFEFQRDPKDKRHLSIEFICSYS